MTALILFFFFNKISLFIYPAKFGKQKMFNTSFHLDRFLYLRVYLCALKLIRFLGNYLKNDDFARAVPGAEVGFGIFCVLPVCSVNR